MLKALYNKIKSYVICVSFGQSCFLISSVLFSVLNNDYPGGSYCGLATFRAIFFLLDNGFCHNSVNSTLRASVLRSAKIFCLKGMCNHVVDLCRLFSKLNIKVEKQGNID